MIGRNRRKLEATSGRNMAGEKKPRIESHWSWPQKPSNNPGSTHGGNRENYTQAGNISVAVVVKIMPDLTVDEML